MGKLNASMLRYLTKEDFRVLIAIEMGMKNHELVPIPLVSSISNIRHGGCFKVLQKMCKYRLISYERGGKMADGYRLTNSGYDYLALNVLSSRGTLAGIGRQIGVGKESDIYVVNNQEHEQFCLKLHRLGRTSFRQLKNKRDYHNNRTQMSWIYLSRISAEKEFKFMKILHEYDFPTPIPIDNNRHGIVMSLCDGYPLTNIAKIENPEYVCQQMVDILVKLAEHSLIHCDFNEFNVLVDDAGKVTMIDFPQMISTYHENAKMYFERDLEGTLSYFSKKYNYDYDGDLPCLDDITTKHRLDLPMRASGYNHCSTENEVPSADGYEENALFEAYHGDSGPQLADNDDETISDDESGTISEYSYASESNNSENDDKNTTKGDGDDVPSLVGGGESALSKYDRLLETLTNIEARSNATSMATSVAPSVMRERIKKQFAVKQAREQRKHMKKESSAVLQGKSRADLSHEIKDGIDCYD